MSGRAIKYPSTPFWLGMFLLRYFMPWFYIYIIYYFGQSVGQMLLNWLATNRNFIKNICCPDFVRKIRTHLQFSPVVNQDFIKKYDKIFFQFFFQLQKSPRVRNGAHQSMDTLLKKDICC